MIDLRFDNVCKRYRIRQGPEKAANQSGLAHMFGSLGRRSEEFWAVRDMSFEVERGQTLGIIGPNGAGKSTILKLLSNITTPTSGEIMINGRISALIEVGSGFHPELTGRENIYLSGSILGMRRREIADKLESIIDFAGVRQFIDTPVKRYSSGMYVRLGFAIAAHLQPDILLLDEVLAVGDTAFQARCFERINELRRDGATIIFISHDLGAVEFLCDRALLIDGGRMVADGLPRDVIIQYERAYGPLQSALVKAETDNHLRRVQITALTLHDRERREEALFHTGRPITMRAEYRAHGSVSDAVFEIFFYSRNGRFHCQLSTALSGEQINLEPGEGAIEFDCAELGLKPGIYYLDATVRPRGAPDCEIIDWLYRGATLRIDPGKTVLGSFYMPHSWRIINDRSRPVCAAIHNQAEVSTAREDHRV